jgi:hypothetical protein
VSRSVPLSFSRRRFILHHFIISIIFPLKRHTSTVSAAEGGANDKLTRGDTIAAAFWKVTENVGDTIFQIAPVLAV